MLTPEEMHRSVDAKLHADLGTAYRADYEVDSMASIGEAFPDAIGVAPGNDWLGRVVTMLAVKAFEGHDLRDPTYVIERFDRAFSVFEPIPRAPGSNYCAKCQPWEASEARLGLTTYMSPKRVKPARFRQGVRVVELLLCRDCAEDLGLDPA